MDTEEEIADAALDLPEVLYSEKLDPVVTSYEIANLPTGTLIVSRGTHFSILFHANDVHCHSGLLVWCAIDGSDKLFLHHEAGKTKPMIFEVDSCLHEAAHYVIMGEVGTLVRNQEFAFLPRQSVIQHPRYLEVFEKLIRILPLAHMSNDIWYGFKHKWQPNIWGSPERNGFNCVRDYYYELAKLDNPLAEGFRQRRRISATCADLVILFLSLLHEELFVNVTEVEKQAGILPVEKNILTHVDDHDVSRLIRPQSQLYELYERESHPFLIGVHTTSKSWDVYYFFLAYIISLVIFGLLYFILPPLAKLIFRAAATG